MAPRGGVHVSRALEEGADPCLLECGWRHSSASVLREDLLTGGTVGLELPEKCTQEGKTTSFSDDQYFANLISSLFPSPDTLAHTLFFSPLGRI